MPEIKQEYTGTWIPAAIMLHEELKPIEKLVYAEIASFPVCWASNAWIAERVGVSERTITTYIKHLKDLKLIVVTETNSTRSCVASQNLLGGVEKFARGVEKFAIKNNNKNKEEKKHTSTLRDDQLPASSSAGDGNKLVMDSAARAAHLEKVFKAVVNVVHEGRPILYTPARKSKLNKRLETFKPSELVTAAKNLMQSDWHTGMNPQKKVYASFDFLIRNDEQVEKWLNEKPVNKPKSVF